MIHQLKCKSKYFEDVVSGKKTFEVRENDRDFHLGDYLALNELAANGIETGTSALFRVVYMLNNSMYCKEGFVILGIKPCMVINECVNPTILKEGVSDGED